MTVRIATWNVWWRFGEADRRAPGIVAALAAIDADVVCLQESWGYLDHAAHDPADVGVMVEDGTGRGRYQAGELAAALELPEWRYAWRISHDHRAFGNAILSRHPIRRTATLPLPRADQAEEHRTALLVEVESPGGPVVVATTHLNFLWGHSNVRQAQVRGICRWLADQRVPDAPVVLTGDLNADPLSDEVRMLTGRAPVPVQGLGFHDAWEAAGDRDGATWAHANSHTPDPPFEGDKRIDYVLCGYPLSDGRSVPVHAEVFGREPDDDGRHPSDHFGVAVDLTVSPRR